MGLLGNPNRVQMRLECMPKRSRNKIWLRKEKGRLKTMEINNGWCVMMAGEGCGTVCV